MNFKSAINAVQEAYIKQIGDWRADSIADLLQLSWFRDIDLKNMDILSETLFVFCSAGEETDSQSKSGDRLRVGEESFPDLWSLHEVLESVWPDVSALKLRRLEKELVRETYLGKLDHYSSEHFKVCFVLVSELEAFIARHKTQCGPFKGN